MCYVCGKSKKMLVHRTNCRYAKNIKKTWRKEYATLEEAVADGYKQCPHCAKISKYLSREKESLDAYAKSHGLDYYYNNRDGNIDVISDMGRWKIIVWGKRNQIWLYHKNTHREQQHTVVKGYHSQNAKSSTILGYFKYITSHDKFRKKSAQYEYMAYGNTRRKYPKPRKKKGKYKMDKRQFMSYLNSYSEAI